MNVNPLDFNNKLSNYYMFDNEIFDYTNQTLYIDRFKSEWVTFENCTFNCKTLDFKNILDKTLILEFNNCTFNCNVIFSHSTFNRLTFKNTKILKSLNLGSGESKFALNIFEFSNDLENQKPELSTDFCIRNTNFEIFVFEKVKHIKGMFRFLGNTIRKQDGNGNISSFGNSTITNILFYNNTFCKYANFKRVIFNSAPEYLKPPGSAFEFPGFYTNTFEKVSFSESNFIGTFQFDNCDFLSTTWFENCRNLNNSELKFVACKFEKYSLFDNSKFNKIEISHSKFLEKASFENFETNYFKINQVTFAEAAYFDDIQIQKIDNCDRRTIRTIKQELQKRENKIDYNRFRVYEFNAYRKDIRKKLIEFKKDKNQFSHRKRDPIQLKRDLFVLNISEIVSDYGTDWKRALKFTLLSGCAAFTLFFILENFDKSFNLSNWKDFVYGYFRFFLITDFKNEYYEAGESILKFNCFISLAPFIIGKIAVAFGIYEMIQSFRKFKA